MEKNLIPNIIKQYQNGLTNIDKKINYDKHIISKNPEIRQYLDCKNNCKNKCKNGKTSFNKSDSCECIKHLTNPILHKFVECTSDCNDLYPTLCYNKCVDNTLHEKIFNDNPFWLEHGLMQLAD